MGIHFYLALITFKMYLHKAENKEKEVGNGPLLYKVGQTWIKQKSKHNGTHSKLYSMRNFTECVFGIARVDWPIR